MATYVLHRVVDLGLYRVRSLSRLYSVRGPNRTEPDPLGRLYFFFQGSLLLFFFFFFGSVGSGPVACVGGVGLYCNMGRVCGVSTELRCGVVCTVQLVRSTEYRSGYG